MAGGPAYPPDRAQGGREHRGPPWLAAARGKLLDALAADLRARLDLDRDEVQSLLRWAQSHTEVTLERCLRSGDA